MQNKAVWQYIHPVCPTLVPPKKFGQENGKTDTLPALPLPKTDTLPAGMRPAGRRSLKNFINNAKKHAFARRYASQVQKRVFYDVPPLPLPTVTSAAPSAPLQPPATSPPQHGADPTGLQTRKSSPVSRARHPLCRLPASTDRTAFACPSMTAHPRTTGRCPGPYCG